MPVPRRAVSELRKLSRRVGGATDDTVRALARSWVAEWDRLTPAWRQAIGAIVADYQSSGIWPPSWRIARIEAVARAQEQTRQSLTVLLTEAARATLSAAVEISAATARAQPGIIAAQLHGGSASPSPGPLVASALQGRQQRIRQLHAPLGTASTEEIRLGLGRQPLAGDPSTWERDLYGRVRRGFDGGLTRASTVARTELIDTYRTTAATVDSANRRLLDGWAWWCVCDRRACPACWAMHGQVFSVDQPGPDGHGGCRCSRMPLAVGNSLPSAETRFRRLSHRDQIAILGPGRWQLWHSGDITWGDLVVQRSNRGWRDSRAPRSLADLRRMAGVRT